MVTPLTTPPNPANSNPTRGMFTWVTSNSTQDPLNSNTKQQNLINFCGATATKTNLIFLDMWNYVGAANWTTTKLSNIRQFMDAASKSGIEVYALAGNADWGINQAWVQTNIIRNIKWFNAQAIDPSKQFKGIIYDVEYWTDNTQTAAVSCPGLCDLMNATRKELDIRVGCFASYYLKDGDGSRATLTYQGKTAQDGEFLVDNSDFVVVGAYRNHANDNMTDGAGQISLSDPWYQYAKAPTTGRVTPLYIASETTNVSPSYITYFGFTKTNMEAQHTLISNNFFVAGNPVFNGQAVHSYDGWNAMSPMQATAQKVEATTKEENTIAKVSKQSPYKWKLDANNPAVQEMLTNFRKETNNPAATLEDMKLAGINASSLSKHNTNPKVGDLLTAFRTSTNNQNATVRDMMAADLELANRLEKFRNGYNDKTIEDMLKADKQTDGIFAWAFKKLTLQA